MACPLSRPLDEDDQPEIDHDKVQKSGIGTLLAVGAFCFVIIALGVVLVLPRFMH